MGVSISSLFNYGDTEELKNEKYSNIFYSLNKISKTIDDTEETLNEIEILIKNIDFSVSDMEWDYYDAPMLENKELPIKII